MTEDQFWGRPAKPGEPRRLEPGDFPAERKVHGEMPGPPTTTGDSPATVQARAQAEITGRQPLWERFVSTEFLTLVFCFAVTLADANQLLNVPEEIYQAAIAYIVSRGLVKAAAAFRSGVKS